MKKIELISCDGRPYIIELPEPVGNDPSAYLFAFHKSGSTLMENMVMTYAHHFHRPVFSVFGAAFQAGISTDNLAADASVCFRPDGMIYTGFRHYPTFDLELKDKTVFFLVRDPRDILVSMYFSVIKSHTVPKDHKNFQAQRREAQNMDIDEFVKFKAPVIQSKFDQYTKNLDMDKLSCYRYEDVIYEKKTWLEDMVTKLNLPMNPDVIQLVVDEFDIFPRKERQDKHIRQVHPGNHKLKLKPETIEFLNMRMHPFLARFNYI